MGCAGVPSGVTPDSDDLEDVVESVTHTGATCEARSAGMASPVWGDITPVGVTPSEGVSDDRSRENSTTEPNSSDVLPVTGTSGADSLTASQREDDDDVRCSNGVQSAVCGVYEENNGSVAVRPSEHQADQNSTAGGGS